MTTAPPTLAQRIDDAINPIVVRELRQAVNSRAIPALLMVLLLLMVASFALIAGRSAGAATLDDRGAELARALMVMLGVGLLVILPIMAGVRLHRERHDRQLELIVISGLRFGRIFMGKLLAALAIEMMILSSILPFATAAIYLRGVDIPAILTAAAWLVMLNVIALAMVLGLACHTMGLVSVCFVCGFAGVFLLIVTLGGVGAATATIDQGPSAIFNELLGGFCVCAGLPLLVTLPIVLAGAADKINHNRTTYHHDADRGDWPIAHRNLDPGRRA